MLCHISDIQRHQEWKEAAVTLDKYLNFEEWKKVDEDSFYDWMLVRKVRRSLKTLREKNDVRGCLGVLETCMRSNFAAVESPRSALCLPSSLLINYQSTRLYSEVCLRTLEMHWRGWNFLPRLSSVPRIWLKVCVLVSIVSIYDELIHVLAYFDELETSLEFIRETPVLSIDEKKRFFKSANTNLGNGSTMLKSYLSLFPLGISALCLSGGASFGYCKISLAIVESLLTH